MDSTNKKLYYTNDSGRSKIRRSDLSFHPSELAFDEEFPDKFVVLDKVDADRRVSLPLGTSHLPPVSWAVNRLVKASANHVPPLFKITRCDLTSDTLNE